MPAFEVGIYNQEVRECTRVSDHHEHLDDSWEDIHYIEIIAEDEEQARSKAQSKYPSNLGYVIEQISQT